MDIWTEYKGKMFCRINGEYFVRNETYRTSCVAVLKEDAIERWSKVDIFDYPAIFFNEWIKMPINNIGIHELVLAGLIKE